MAKILLVSENEKKGKEFQEILQKNSHEFSYADNPLMTMDIVKTQLPDIIILDTEVKKFDLKTVSKSIKSFENIQTILLSQSDDIEPELLKTANAFLQYPVSKKFLISTVNANLKTKNSLEKLANSNQELARSLYQLNVLYNTSSQFAGTLDKNKLLEIMVDGMDKSLSFGLACTLTFKSENEPVLIIYSLYKISDRLLEALKLRAALNYKSLFDKKEMPFELDINNLKIEKHVKHSIKEYDFSVLRFDGMFAPIALSENFFGFIEVFRETEFSTEDATCFQTLAQQVSLPLKSATLYEIKEQTNRKLERLERLKSEFISIVSHELRTPLTAIRNSLDILLSGKSGDLTENMNKFLNMAKRNSQRLSGIINDLLDLSKIEAGKMDFKFAISKIEPVIEYVKTNLEELAKEKNLHLITRLEDNFADIYADAQRLEQVLMNLVSNAIKFTPEGGKIELRTEVIDAKDINPVEMFEEELKKLKGKYLQVCVKDNGIGISAEHLAHVFDKFAQIETSLSRKVGGSGLGLPIAKQLLDTHNGTIWCNSKPDKGSSFYFVVPLSSEKNNFMLDLKQSLQKAKVNNSSLALIKLKAENELMQDLQKNVIIETYLNNSFKEIDDKHTSLIMVIPDGDKFSADFLKKKINGYFKDRKNLYPTYAIMYSYGVYPDDAADEVELIRKVNEGLRKIKD
ncbi:MAG: ATP-binding protein [Candidatus Gastranaerophilales bacterium]|nr:ATP-binding protein [Candidatus Gastranaerophilales bacterium]